MEAEFRKCLAKYYIKWFNDCHESAIYCREHGNEEKARYYLNRARKHLNVIMENWDAIEYFTVNEEKAYVIESALPKEFRGYD